MEALVIHYGGFLLIGDAFCYHTLLIFPFIQMNTKVYSKQNRLSFGPSRDFLNPLSVNKSQLQFKLMTATLCKHT